MNQTLHIVGKDLRYLWRECTLVAVLAAAYAWSETHPLALRVGGVAGPLLLSVAGVFLIARLIHAEAIVGDRQFWLTRPYRWQSLLAAKLISLLVFVNVPILLARLYVVAKIGFPLGVSVPGVLWSQLLMLLLAELPIAALASLMPGTVSLMMAILVVCALVLFMNPLMYFLDLSPTPWPSSVNWIRNSLLGVTLLAMAVPVLYLQYKKRCTAVNYMLSMAIGVTGLAICWNIPTSFGMNLQSRLSRQPFDTAVLEVSLDPTASKTLPRFYQPNGVRLALPVLVKGVPAGIELQVESFKASFRGIDGRTAESDVVVSASHPNGSQVNFDGGLVLDQEFFKVEGDRPVTLHGELFVTAFGNRREQTIPVTSEAVDVFDGMRCSRGVFDMLVCRTPMRWPGALVSVKLATLDKTIWPDISYSPFPAALSFDNFEEHGTSGVSAFEKTATISVKEPLSHFLLEFDQELILPEFAKSSPSR